MDKLEDKITVVIERTRKYSSRVDFIVKLAAILIGVYEVLFIFRFHFYLYDLLAKLGIEVSVLQQGFQDKQGMAFVLGMLLLIAFLVYPPLLKEDYMTKVHWFDYILVLLSLSSMFYMFARYPSFTVYYEVSGWDIPFGLIAIALVLEATRRSLGWILPAIVLVFLVIGIEDTNYNWSRFVQYLYLDQGIFGTPFFVMTIYVFAFIFFGAFLLKIGVSDYMTQLMITIFGTKPGGPAKSAVVSSALMGTVSGSSVANVLTTGTFTIPLMKKAGYPPEIAGAVEPVASTGGQLMPPIMGAAAFIMAQFLGIPYNKIIIAAIIPAIVYYAGVYIFIDLETKRLGLKGVSKESLMPLSYFTRKAYILLPIVVITVALVWGIAPHIAAISCLGIAIWVAWISKDEISGSEKIYSIILLFTTLLMFTEDKIAKPVSFVLFVFLLFLVIAGLTYKRSISFNEKFFMSFLFIGFLALVKYMGIRKESVLFMSGVFGIVFSLLIGWFSKSDQGKAMFKATFESMIDAGRTSTSIMLAAASAGLIQGVLTMTGLVTSLGYKLVDLTGGVLILILIMSMVFSLILGMGVPTTANYVITSLVAAPAVYKAVAETGGIYMERVLGYGTPVALLAAHFFVFYFGILADLTPPVALASYAGSALAGGDFWQTSKNSVRYALAGFIGPYIYFLNPEMFLITIKTWNVMVILKILFLLSVTILMMYMLGVAVTGYFKGKINLLLRVVIGVLALVTSTLNPVLIIISIGVMTILWLMRRKEASTSITN
ncbi:MAG: TRAP transporter fused permease subunit [Synergistetes bacterium]|nr:TRAP transporter fused permease subunit [Synergistota bacterium]MCX8128115.1 TRAP transporter fused permease subunit [Synergistota bacterium]MDW8192491.1 TRAP transporter fused permease subunit [Synergistota bacterium]